MSDVAFFYTSNDQPLPFDAEEGRFVWRQYHKGRGSWYVRVSDQNIKSVFIKVAEAEFTLAKHTGNRAIGNCWILSDDIQKDLAEWIKYETNQEPKPGSWVALLDLWSSDGKGPPQQLNPPLYIEPGNLSDKDFEAITQRLQELAFFRYSPTKIKREDRGGGREGGTEDNEDELLKQAADKFLVLINQIHYNWPLVQMAASRETQLLPKMVDVSSASGSCSSRLAVKAAQHPHARRVEILMPQESFATIENRFLAYALKEICQRCPVFLSRLTTRSSALRAEREPSDDKGRKSERKSSQPKEKQSVELQMADSLTSLAQDINSAAEAIASYINDPFLHEVRDHPALPVRPTDRLTRSFAYGPIYGAFCDYHNQFGISFEPLKLGLMQALNTKAIHPARTLYELWVFVELYDMLIHTFGFQPPAEGVWRHPLDYVDVAVGEIVEDALKGKEFRLELRPANNQQRVIEVSLWYDTKRPAPDCVPNPDPAKQKRCYDAKICHDLPCYRERHITKHWRELQPDIYLEAKDSSQAGEKRFAIDAKYRNYQDFAITPKDRLKYDVRNTYELDLLMTAKMKYRDALGCDAAFVVHSDADEDNYKFWGDKPYKIVPHRERRQSENWGPGHHYGAVFSNPSNTHNLRKLLKCFLMYHIGIENICWSCRSEIESSNKFIDDRTDHIQFEDGIPVGTAQVPGEQRLVGRNYVCTNCSRSWYRTWCSNPKAKNEHRIFKLGPDDFHRKETGHVVCAVCGDGTQDAPKTSKQVSQRRSVVQEETRWRR